MSTGRSWRKIIAWPQRNSGKTIQCLRGGKQFSPSIVYNAVGGCWPQLRGIVERWREIICSIYKTWAVEVEPEDQEVGQPNTRAKVVKKLLCGRTPGMHEFCPEYLTFLHVWCVSWVTHLCNIMQQSGTVPLDWQIKSPCSRRRTGAWGPGTAGAQYSASRESWPQEQNLTAGWIWRKRSDLSPCSVLVWLKVLWQ